MALDDFLANGQADAGAGKLAPRMQPLEQTKNPVKVLRIDADPVVLDRKQPLRSGILDGADMDLRDGVAVILDRVADEVLKQLNQLRFIRQNAGEWIMRHPSATVFHGAP